MQVCGVVEELLAEGGGVARVRLLDDSIVECPAGSLVSPGARASCTAYSGEAPSERNLGTACMGHLVRLFRASGSRHDEVAAESNAAGARSVDRLA